MVYGAWCRVCGIWYGVWYINTYMYIHKDPTAHSGIPPYMAVSTKVGVLVGVLKTRALPFWICIRALDVGNSHILTYL